MMEFISNYQTMIVGIIGFTGVIITLIVNAKITRDQRLAALRHEANSIRQGLIAELSSLRNTYIERIKTGDGSKDFLIPKKVNDDFYRVMLPQLGKLTLDEIDMVMHAYLLVAEVPIKMLMLSPRKDKDQPYDGNIHVESKNVRYVKGIHQMILEKVEKAMETLQKTLDQR